MILGPISQNTVLASRDSMLYTARKPCGNLLLEAMLLRGCLDRRWSRTLPLRSRNSWIQRDRTVTTSISRGLTLYTENISHIFPHSAEQQRSRTPNVLTKKDPNLEICPVDVKWTDKLTENKYKNYSEPFERMSTPNVASERRAFEYSSNIFNQPEVCPTIMSTLSNYASK